MVAHLDQGYGAGKGSSGTSERVDKPSTPVPHYQLVMPNVGASTS